VKAHLSKAKLSVAPSHLNLPVRAEGKRGVSAANDIFPVMFEGFCGLYQTTGKIRQVFVSGLNTSTPAAIEPIFGNSYGGRYEL
jgi:hypothetical protein